MRLAEDEMLVVEARPPRCDYWMFVLSIHWLETAGHAHGTIGVRWVGPDVSDVIPSARVERL